MNNRLSALAISARGCATTLIAASTLYAQPNTSPAASGPCLETICAISKYSQNLPPTAPASLRAFRGLLIEERLLTDLYALTLHVFFDSGSADLEKQYNLFANPSQTKDFNDTLVPGGTMQKYYQVLNFVGYRMQKYPATTIRLVGTNSGERNIGESRTMSRKRAERVRNYLTDIWRIDPKRIILLPPQDLPKVPSEVNDPLGAPENRRVEILSDDFEITHPILHSDFRRYPQPDSMVFRMGNGIPDEMIADRQIEICHDGTHWHTIGNIGTSDTISPPFYWGPNNDIDVMLMPTTQSPYSAQLVIQTIDGREIRSPAVEIPVRVVRPQVSRSCITDSVVLVYNIILFDFDRSHISAVARRLIDEFILPEITPESKIRITGHTDVIGSTSYNQALSENRATACGETIAASDITWTERSTNGAGELHPLFRNDLPEGRFYNRMVQVIVTKPMTHPEWK